MSDLFEKRKMNKWMFFILLGTLVVTASGCPDKKEDIEEFLDETGIQSELFKKCTYPEKPDSQSLVVCSGSSRVGDGVECLKTRYNPGRNDKECNKSISFEQLVKLGWLTKVKLESSSYNRVAVNMLRKPIEAIKHTHLHEGEGGASCADEILVSKDYIYYKISIYNKNKVSVGVDNSSFLLEVANTNGKTFSQRHEFCVYEPDGRSCSAEGVGIDEIPKEEPEIDENDVPDWWLDKKEENENVDDS